MWPEERLEESRARLPLRRRGPSPHAHPGFDERPGEPWPHRPLVVGAVPLGDAALRSGPRRPGRPAASDRSPERRPEARFDRVHDAPRPVPFESAKGSPPTAKIWLGRKRASAVPAT